MRKHVTIYIDGEVWEWAKGEAWSLKKSGSRYLEDLIRGEMVDSGQKEAQPEKFPSHVPKATKKEKINKLRDGLAFFNPQPKEGK